MSNTSKTFAENTIVAFHIGRGGRFNNPGFLRYCDNKKIGHYANDLFSRYENEYKFKSRYGFDSTNDKDQKCILDLITDEAFEELEEKFGITVEMLGEQRYYDAVGHDTGLTEAAVRSGIGRIEIDNDYDTTYTCYLANCNENELHAIVSATGYVDSDIMDYAKEQLGIVDEEESNQ